MEQSEEEETDSRDAVKFIELTLKFYVQRNALEDKTLRIWTVVFKLKWAFDT